MKKRIQLKKNSILIKVLIPMLVLLLVQCLVFMGAILFSGTIDQIDSNATHMLDEAVLNRKNYLQNEMVSRWSNVSTAVESVNSVTKEATRASGDYSALESDETIAVEAIENLTGTMIQLLRRNSVTGAFIVFGTEYSSVREKYGFYIRDDDPMAAASGSSDLLLLRAPRAVVEKLSNLAIDPNWDTKFSFPHDMTRNKYAYFREPITAQRDHAEMTYKDLAYWCAPFYFEGTDKHIVTYSVPLISESGEAYGVLGVDLSVDYLKKLLPFSELDANNNGAYVLAVDDMSDNHFSPAVGSGPVYAAAFSPAFDLEICQDKTFGDDCYKLGDVGGRNGQVVGCVQYLQLYNSNTPFERERWAVIAMVDESHLFAFSRGLTNWIIVAVVVSSVLGLLAVGFVAVWLSRPIRKTIENMRAKRGGEIELDRTGIFEIDELLSSIETLSESVSEASTKLSRILDEANVPLGAFEFNKAEKKVFCTDRFFELIGYPEEDAAVITWQRFSELMHGFESNFVRMQEDGKMRVYQYVSSNGTDHWVQMRLVGTPEKMLGIVQDVTDEVLERQRIEHERDYDFLTGLLNAQAFKGQTERMLEAKETLGSGALLMIGIDNLKYINDTYGYAYGDEFLRRIGRTIGEFPAAGLLSGRSANEFLVFLYGYPDLLLLERDVASLKKTLRGVKLTLPNGSEVEARDSCGYALCPRDAASYDALYRYADFALFECENECRGEYHPFIPKNYSESSYLLHNREELTKLIEQELVEYFFQPIVDAQTGRVYGYEALMRSKLDTIKSPLEVLALARSQSKLAQIERLTWFKAMQAYSDQVDAFGGRKIFFNSMSNQMLTEEEIADFEERFQPHLGKIVMEFTEGERYNEAYMLQKRGYLMKWSGKIALDDFGTGYNGDIVLLTLAPNLIKVDMSIIHGIDEDPNRKSMFMNILSYAKERKIKVIAEGVETSGEMQTLIRCGVDYLQGFYLGRPERTPQQIPKEMRREILDCRAAF